MRPSIWLKFGTHIYWESKGKYQYQNMLKIQGVISDFTQKAVELLSSLKVRNKLKIGM